MILIFPAFLAGQYVPDGRFMGEAPDRTPTATSETLSPSLASFTGQLKLRSADAHVLARERGLRMHADGSVVLYALVKEDTRAARRAIEAKGGRILREDRTTMEFSIAPAALASLAALEGVRITEPLRPHPLVIEGENVVLTKATNAHTNNWRGQNIKVGIIDGGFYSNTEAIAAGELPSTVIMRDFTGTGFEAASDGVHGTAVAEVVHEMAPAAQLILCKIDTGLQLRDAISYCTAMGVNIINHSMVWFGDGTGRGDGYVCSLINNASSSGILWVNSAGNHAQRHWTAVFNDVNSDSYHDFSGTVNVNQIGSPSAGATIKVFLTWDDTWGASGNDYALTLVRWNGSSWVTVGTSDSVQNGDDFPVEGIVTTSTGSPYGAVIRKMRGNARTLRLFSANSDIQYTVSTGSITTPADAKGAFAVGAIDYLNWSSGPTESYSSLGPTMDGRIKPKICGVDNNTNSMYIRFTGTSSASPCVAGAAAVIWSAYQTCAARDVWNSLMHYARDLGTAGIDPVYGAGAVDISVFKRYAAINNAYRGVGDVIFDGMPQGAVVNIYTISGKFVAAVTAADASGSVHWSVRNAGGQKVAPGVYYCTVTLPGGSTRTERLMIVRSRMN